MKPPSRVFALVPDCHAATHYGPLWRRHFYEGLAGVIPQVVFASGVDYGWARRLPGAPEGDLEGGKARTSDQLWEQIQVAHRQQGIEAVVSYCFAADVEVGLVRDTIRLGVPWVNFFCDSTHRFPEVAPLAQVVSLNWFPERAAVTCYGALGVPHVCRPYALNPHYLPALSPRNPRHQVGFVGLPTANRITQLGWLRLLGQPVAVRGAGWVGVADNPFQATASLGRRLRRALTRPDLAEKVMRRLAWPLVRPLAGEALSDTEFEAFLQDCRVMLGLNQGRDQRGRFRSYLKFRDVEFPGYGCCYLTQFNEDMAAAFEVGQEVLVYRSMPEAAALLRRVARGELDARRVGDAGRRRVLAAHTWAARLPEIFRPL